MSKDFLFFIFWGGGGGGAGAGAGAAGWGERGEMYDFFERGTSHWEIIRVMRLI